MVTTVHPIGRVFVANSDAPWYPQQRRGSFRGLDISHGHTFSTMAGVRSVAEHWSSKVSHIQIVTGECRI